jgi:hypothetical protein
VKIGTAIHSALNGLLLAVIAALFGALGTGLWSLHSLEVVALAAVGTYTSAAVVRNSPAWLAWLAAKLGATPPPPPAATVGILLMLGLAISLANCAPPAAAGATITVLAAGDTARVFAHWPAVNRATSYTYTLATVATNGTWVGLPVGQSTTSTSGSAFPTSATADTAVFQLCVTALGPAGSSPVGCTASTGNAANTWRRKLGTPAPVMDSVTAMLVLPSVIVKLPVGSTVAMCGFPVMPDGHVVMRTADTIRCLSSYTQSYSSAQRAVLPDQQQFVDGLCISWRSSDTTVVTVTTDPLCSVTGFRVGLAPPRFQWLAPGVPADMTRVGLTHRA